MEWVAIDAESKLVPSWLLGERKTADCIAFLDDLRDRLRYRVQPSTDAHESRGLRRSRSASQLERAYEQLAESDRAG